MKRFLAGRSFHTQMVLVGVFCALLSACGVLLVTQPNIPFAELRFRVALILTITGLLGIGLIMVAVRQFVRGLRHLGEGVTQVIDGRLDAVRFHDMPNQEMQQLKATFDRMVRELRQTQLGLAARTRTLGQLLEFTNTIQRATAEEQVLTCLIDSLRLELRLGGVMVLDESRLSPFASGADLRALSVSLWQSVVVHMLLPVGEKWNEERKGLAEAYINSARSVLISLDHLHEAEKQSMTDPLTGLFNRRSLEQLLQREVLLAERHTQPLSLVMVDMDHFKQINDAHGHAAGDHLLKALADCIRHTLRKTDLAFRYGGDEFVIALPQTTLHQAEQVVQKLRQEFATVDFEEAIPHLVHTPTLSIGLAERSAVCNTLTLPLLLCAVDQALYDAKNRGRNCVRIYSPPRAA